MREKEPKPPVPASLVEISSFATSLAANTRAAAPTYAQLVQQTWKDCVDNLTHRDGLWIGSLEVFEQLWKQIHKHSHVLKNKDIDVLTRLLESRGPIHDDWYSLSGFLMHDIYHTVPDEMMQFYVTTESSFISWGEGRLFDRHKEYLDQATKNAAHLATQFAYPLEFIAAVADIEQGMPVDTKPTNMKDFLYTMGLLIAGRIAVDDYYIAVNEKPDERRNNLIIEVDDTLQITINQGMLFGVVYNLVKNAAKANGQKHYDENDQALSKAYRNEGNLKHPRNLSMKVNQTNEHIQITVGDDGAGISLDTSIARFRNELGIRLAQNDRESVRTSEWFRNIQRAVGNSQAESLLAWPSNPMALREVGIGTVFDLQFISGFSQNSWEIRSLTSGMGLWGVRYITEKLGGSVIGTNQFDKGALFTLTLPKKNLI